MPRFQKWLVGIANESPADEVARLALTERLLAVSHFLDECLRGDDETESIHQLRVWSRRAAATMNMFQPALPTSRRREVMKKLTKLRHVAGSVRDCDIHLEQLRQNIALVPKPVIKGIKQERRDARRKLRKLQRRLRSDSQLPMDIERLLAAVQWPKKHSNRKPPAFGTFCRRQLSQFASAFFKLADTNLNDDRKQHALRIAAKEWRYALELAPVALHAGTHRRLYQSLSELQDRSGKVCDCLAAIEQLQTWQDAVSKESHRQRLLELIQREQNRLQRLRGEVVRWWSPARRKRLRQLWQKAALH
jgi:CHAD domain-containing protein